MCKALEELEERGRQEGRLEGRLQGQIENKLKLIVKKIHKNKSFDQIVDELEEDADVVQPLYDFVRSLLMLLFLPVLSYSPDT